MSGIKINIDKFIKRAFQEKIENALNIFIFLYTVSNKNKQNKNITMGQFNKKIDLNTAIVILQEYSEFCYKELGK